jgi:hypothetical protein
MTGYADWTPPFARVAVDSVTSHDITVGVTGTTP